MKITHNKVGQNLNLSDSGKTDKSKKNDAVSQSNNNLNELSNNGLNANKSANESVKIDLSARAQDIQRAKELAMKSPDVDQNKVEKFQKLIDEGKYKVDAKAIAEKMVQEHLSANQSETN